MTGRIPVGADVGFRLPGAWRFVEKMAMKLDWQEGEGPRNRRDLRSLMVFPDEVTRSVTVRGVRHTIRIEADIWDGFKEIIKADKRALADVCEELAVELSPEMSLTTAVRVFVLNHYARQARPTEPPVLVG